MIYWKCEECDEINPYPDVKICETCGSPMTPAAEQRALREHRDEEKRREKMRRIAQRRQREQENIRRAKEWRKKEEKIYGAMRKTSKIMSAVICAFAFIALGVSIGICFQNRESFNLGQPFLQAGAAVKTEYQAHLISPEENTDETGGPETDGGSSSSDEKQEITRLPRSVYNIRKAFIFLADDFNPVKNIGNQIKYLSETFHPIDNIAKLFENISYKFSGGDV